MGPRKKTSTVWNSFKVLPSDPKVVVCQLCNKQLSYDGNSTGNLNKHLSQVHSGHAASTSSTNQTTMKQPTLSMFKGCALPHEQITQRITDMVVSDCLPLSIVEGRGFTRLMDYVCPGYSMPTRNTIKHRIFKQYATRKEELKEDLAGATCGLTSDHWTSVSTEPYITVTAHTITPDWEMESHVLEAKETTESHTGVNIATDMIKAAGDWDIQAEGWVHDQARNMKSAATEIKERLPTEGNFESIDCGAHMLQTSIKPALELDEAAHLIKRAK